MTSLIPRAAGKPWMELDRSFLCQVWQEAGEATAGRKLKHVQHEAVRPGPRQRGREMASLAKTWA